MTGAGGSEPPPPPLPLEVEAFKALMAALPKKKPVEVSQFVKRLEEIYVVALSLEQPMKFALSLVERALVGI